MSRKNYSKPTSAPQKIRWPWDDMKYFMRSLFLRYLQQLNEIGLFFNPGTLDLVNLLPKDFRAGS